MPPETQKGKLSTIEGFLRHTYESLDELQPLRRAQYPEAAAKIDEVLQKIDYFLEVDMPFTFIVDDPSGNSFIENPLAPISDPALTKKEYPRTEDQNIAIGLTADTPVEQPEISKLPTDKKADVHYHSEWFGGDDSVMQKPIKAADIDDVIIFQHTCEACHRMGEERMVKVEIPYFKEIVLMSFVCDHCGYRNNEIKSGGSISEKGKRIELSVNKIEDLSRDILKSDTASLEVPEIDLYLAEGTLGGRFTTVEGILTMVRDELMRNPFMVGDSTHPIHREKWKTFVSGLKSLIDGEKPFTFILDDPVANSYIQSYTVPDPDPQIKELFYERTEEQNDDLGLLHMNTADFETIDDDKDSDEDAEEST